MKKITTIMAAMLLLAVSTAQAAVSFTGEIIVPAGATNATEIVTLGRADQINAFRLERVFASMEYLNYTGTVSVATSDWGYSTVIGTASGLLKTKPVEIFPLRTYVGANNATNQTQYIVKALALTVNFSAGTTVADRKVRYVIYAE